MKNNLEIRQMLEEFVKIPSVNPGDCETREDCTYGEKRFVEYVQELLKSKGYYCERQEVLPGRPNLLIGTGEHFGEKPIILFQTHSDVVDVKGMEGAFCPEVSGEKLKGRGSCDAKGQLCTMIMALEQLKDQIANLPFDICIALCCDEEFKHRGVDELLNWEHIDKVLLAVVGEPTELRMASACKGSIRFCIETTGVSAHTSVPDEGENAIYLMAKIVQILYSKVEKQTICRKDTRCGSATLAVSLIQGGTIVNSVPDHCLIHVDRRMIPGEEWEAVYQEIKKIICNELTEIERTRVKFDRPYLIDPPYGTEIPEDLNCILENILKMHGLDEKIGGLPYGCDASKLAKLNFPVFVFGPGSINQAHTKEEYIELTQIAKGADVLKDLIMQFARGDDNRGIIGKNY